MSPVGVIGVDRGVVTEMEGSWQLRGRLGGGRCPGLLAGAAWRRGWGDRGRGAAGRAGGLTRPAWGDRRCGGP